jgi:hypothetical protein
LADFFALRGAFVLRAGARLALRTALAFFAFLFFAAMSFTPGVFDEKNAAAWKSRRSFSGRQRPGTTGIVSLGAGAGAAAGLAFLAVAFFFRAGLFAFFAGFLALFFAAPFFDFFGAALFAFLGLATFFAFFFFLAAMSFTPWFLV